jgi:hypothetical protein
VTIGTIPIPPTAPRVLLSRGAPSSLEANSDEIRCTVRYNIIPHPVPVRYCVLQVGGLSPPGLYCIKPRPRGQNLYGYRTVLCLYFSQIIIICVLGSASPISIILLVKCATCTVRIHLALHTDTEQNGVVHYYMYYYYMIYKNLNRRDARRYLPYCVVST